MNDPNKYFALFIDCCNHDNFTPRVQDVPLVYPTGNVGGIFSEPSVEIILPKRLGLLERLSTLLKVA